MSTASSDKWLTIERSRSRRIISELELVLIAVGIEAQISRDLWGWSLQTREEQAPLARYQLYLYRVENRPKTARPDPLPFKVGVTHVVIYAVVLATFWVFQIADVFDVMDYGSLHAPSVRDGSWWLGFTALTLHGDFGHLLSNCLFGGVVGWAVVRYFGIGFGWLLILLAGAIGNLSTVWLRSDTVVALGASTAVFGGVGILCGYLAYRRFVRGQKASINYAPLAAGIAIFALFGVGGENTDVLGHVAGFVVGTAMGTILGKFDPRWLGSSGQHISLGAVVALLLFGWVQVLAS